MINNCNSQNSETEAWLDDNEERGGNLFVVIEEKI